MPTGLTFQLEISEQADARLGLLRADRSQSQHRKAVEKALRFLASDPRHPSLNTHEWQGDKCPHGDKLWEAYAENNTPAAHRIFFCYPTAEQGMIYVVAITPHP